MSKPNIEFRVIKLGKTPEMIGMRKTHKAAIALWNSIAYKNKHEDFILVKYKDDNADINFIVDFVRAGHKPINPADIQQTTLTTVENIEPKEKPLTNKEIDAMGLTPPFKSDEEAMEVFVEMLSKWSSKIDDEDDEGEEDE